MSMHLVGPYMTTTKYNRKQRQTKNKRLQQAQAEHEAWLKSMGVGRTELPVYARGRRIGIHSIPDYREHQATARLSDQVAASAPARQQQQYTGDEIAGIVTTHKSNLMPVRRDNKRAIVDAAQMRRS
jgi:hypothetical protein